MTVMAIRKLRVVSAVPCVCFDGLDTKPHTYEISLLANNKGDGAYVLGLSIAPKI